jgi:SNF2 family DNA or RNA helicase
MLRCLLSLSVLAVDTPHLNARAELWAHQREGIALAKDRQFFLAAWDPGVGKTRAGIEMLQDKYRSACGLLPTLILCPPIVIPNWRSEILKYSDIDPGSIFMLTGPGKKRYAKLVEACQAPHRGNAICITNYEALLMPELFKGLQAWAPQCIVYDEIHRCKDIQAKRTKAAIQLADLAEVFRLGLTGTPVLNSPMDLFSQYRILDGGENFGKNFFAFRAAHMRDRNAYMPKQKYFPDWVPTAEGNEAIAKVLARTSSVVKKEECLDLPPLVQKVIEVELSGEQQRVYDAMKKDFIAHIGDMACVAQLAITKALRLQQIVSGHLPVEGEAGESAVQRFTNTPRVAALKELLADIAPHHKVLVWASFQQDYVTVRGVCAGLGLPCVEVHGAVSQREKEAAVERFETDPGVRVFIGHPSSGGIGINLVAASYAIYFSRSFSLEQRIQSIARNYRAGSERHEKITLIDIVAKGTIDEIVLQALEQKNQLSLELLRREFHA